MHGDYPLDFFEHEKINLRFQLKYFEFDVHNDSKLQNYFNDWNRQKKLKTYHLIDRFIHLVLTLLMFTASTKQAFSALKVFKIKLCNKMENEFLANSLVVYIEWKIAGN